MNKLLIIVISMIFLFLWIPPSVMQAEDTIRFEVINGDTLVVSGTGEVGSVVDFDRKGKKIKLSDIKKLIFKEGITKISATHAADLIHLEKIVLPDSLVELDEYAFSCNDSLKEIMFGKNLTKVGTGAFTGCDNLKQVVLPDTVTDIGVGAFTDCVRLRKLVLPASLSSWDIYAVHLCPNLREIVNRSQVPCEMAWYGKYVTWKVGKKKTKVIPPGKTGKTVRKKIPIKYQLYGGKATGKLPKYYRFGDEVELPECVQRDGYVFMGWSSSMYDSITMIKPGQKKAEFYATWCKFKVESKKSGTATVTFDSKESAWALREFAIRYSLNKNMKGKEVVYCEQWKTKVTIKNLWPGRTYYFQISAVRDGDLDFSDWRGKRGVSICI